MAAAVAAARTAGPSAALPRLPSVLLQAGHEESKLLACALWLRQAAARLLVWNHNYNVKPREISAAQEKLTAALTDIWLAWCACIVTPTSVSIMPHTDSTGCISEAYEHGTERALSTSDAVEGVCMWCSLSRRQLGALITGC